MVDRKVVFAAARAEFQADYPELAVQAPHWLDVAERAFGVTADAIDERARVLAAAGEPATEEQIGDVARTSARLALVDTAARWQRGSR